MGCGFQSRCVPPRCQLIKADVVIMHSLRSCVFCPPYNLQILFISREADTIRAQRDSRSGMGGGDTQEIIVVVLLEAEDDAEAGILKAHQEKEK